MLSTKRMSKILGIVLLLAFMPLWVMAQTAVETPETPETPETND